MTNNNDLSTEQIKKFSYQLEIGNWKNVILALNVLKDDYPNSPNLYLLYGISYSQAMIDNGDIDKPIFFFDKSKSLGLPVKVYNTNIKEHYSRAGLYLYHVDNYEDSYKYLIKSTEFGTFNNHIYVCNVGNVLLKLNKTAEAIEMYKKSIKINNNYAIAHSNLGICYYNNKHYDDALKNFLTCTLLNNIEPFYMINYANCLWALERKDEALEAYYKVRMLDPSNVDSYTLLCSSLSFLGREKELQDLILVNIDEINTKPGDKISESKISKFLDLLISLSESYFKTKDFYKSIDILNKALEINSNNPVIHRSIIKSYKEIGDNQKEKIHSDKLSKLLKQAKDSD